MKKYRNKLRALCKKENIPKPRIYITRIQHPSTDTLVEVVLVANGIRKIIEGNKPIDELIEILAKQIFDELI